MNTQQIQAITSRARECALAMMENASYIQRELPDVRLPDDLRLRATELCSDLIGTKHDIVSELFELDELVAAPSADPVVLAARIERIVRWLGDDLPKMHQLITALQTAAERDPDYAMAYVLIAESAANILYAFNRVREATDRIEEDSSADPSA